MKKTIVTVFLLTVMAVIVVWLVDVDSEQSSVDPNPTADTQTPPTKTDVESLGEGTIDAQPQPKSVAKTLVKVPQGKPKSRNSDLNDDLAILLLENPEEYTRQNLEAALSGDLYAGVRLSDELRRCQGVPKTDHDIDLEIIDQIARTNLMRDSNPDRDYPTDVSIRERQLNRYHLCRQKTGIFTDQLREKLDRLAQEGNVVARYLYATWRPDNITDPNYVLTLQEWTLKANEYSFLNMEQGEVAGLMAFGAAYTHAQLFTGGDTVLGHSFILAAYICGHIDPFAEYVMAHLDKGNVPDGQLSRHSKTLEISNRLSEYCR